VCLEFLLVCVCANAPGCVLLLLLLLLLLHHQ
jgi:hypothetical protein